MNYMLIDSFDFPRDSVDIGYDLFTTFDRCIFQAIVENLGEEIKHNDFWLIDRLRQETKYYNKIPKIYLFKYIKKPIPTNFNNLAGYQDKPRYWSLMVEEPNIKTYNTISFNPRELDVNTSGSF